MRRHASQAGASGPAPIVTGGRSAAVSVRLGGTFVRASLSSARASGGTGRRARFRSVYPKGCGGSTPPSRTLRAGDQAPGRRPGVFVVPQPYRGTCRSPHQAAIPPFRPTSAGPSVHRDAADTDRAPRSANVVGAVLIASRWTLPAGASQGAASHIGLACPQHRPVSGGSREHQDHRCCGTRHRRHHRARHPALTGERLRQADPPPGGEATKVHAATLRRGDKTNGVSRRLGVVEAHLVEGAVEPYGSFRLPLVSHLRKGDRSA